MDRAGVRTAMTSVAPPGVWFGDNAAARALARESNDYAARIAADHPGRFGVFAALPLPDVEGSLTEIEYAFDVLKADGVGLMTSVNQQWLGDRAFAPVMDELNRRKAVVYVHPTCPHCCRNLMADVPDHLIEFATDTTRTIASLMLTGTAHRCPDIRFIFAHAGGTMPFITERMTWWADVKKDLVAQMPNGPLHELKRFFYDTGFSANAYALVVAAAAGIGVTGHVRHRFPVSRLRRERRGPEGLRFRARAIFAPSSGTTRCGSCRSSRGERASLIE